MEKRNLEELLNPELIESMKKRPGMYIGTTAYGIQYLLFHLAGLVLHSSDEPIEIQWIIEMDNQCSLKITGGNLEDLKDWLTNFTQIEDMADDYKYIIDSYLYFLFLTEIEVTLVINEEKLCIKKVNDTMTYSKENTNINDEFIMNVTFDKTLFHKQAFLYEEHVKYVQMYAYQYSNLTMILKDERELKQMNTFHYSNGIKDKLNDFNYKKNNGKPRLWEGWYKCSIDEVEIELCFYIDDRGYGHPSKTVIYASDDIELYLDESVKGAFLNAMKQSMEEFSQKHNLKLKFKKSQLNFLFDFVASIHGENLEYSGSWRTGLDMREITDQLEINMKQYFDKLFESDKKYMSIINEIGFKEGNTLFLDAVFRED